MEVKKWVEKRNRYILSQMRIVLGPIKNPCQKGFIKTQAKAVDKAKDQAKREGNTEVIIHGKDGKIRNPNTYRRKDYPRKTKGR